jgi:hypothetical protein
MKYKLEHKNSNEPTYCSEMALSLYQRKGWKIVDDTPKQLSDKRYDRLKLSHLRELCSEQGIEFVEEDTRRVLINKLLLVSTKTVIQPSASNKGFHDSLLKK